MARTDQDQDPNSTKFTEKQKRFIQEYLIDFNGTKAAQRAGYSEKTAYSSASNLLNLPKVRKAITKAQEENSNNWIVNVNWVLSQYLRVFDKCMQNEPVMEWDNEQKALVESGEYKFDSRGALTALDKIGNHVGFDAVQKQKDQVTKLEIEFKGNQKQVENIKASSDEIED